VASLGDGTVERSSPWRGRIAGFLVGAIPAFAFPAPSIWVLGFVGLVPWLVIVIAAPSRREAGWRTGYAGAGFFVALHHWLIPTVRPFFLVLGALLGVLWVPSGLIAWSLLHDRATPRRMLLAVWLVPTAWVLIEWLRSWDRLGGPWGLLGATQWKNRPVLALAELGGVWLVSLVLVAVNVSLAGAAAGWRGRSSRSTAIVLTLALAAGAWGYGWLQSDPSPAGTMTVAGVQTGVIHGPELRFDAHERLTRTLQPGDLDLIVWAESSIGIDLTASPEYLERLRLLAVEVDAPLLVNVDARRTGDRIYKSSTLVDASGISDRYDKMRLVPFGEYVPLRPALGWITAFTDAAGEDRGRGDGLVVMDVGGVGVGPLVCFESAFPDLSRHLARAGADVIVPQTATTTFQGSWAQAQHASLGAVRAVESGRPVIHAAVSGDSAVFTATGERLMWLSHDRTGTWRVTVPLVDGTTPYVRLGEWVPLLAIVSLGVAALAARPKEQRR
jgi:apolipoprotein N-acyltransferase